MSRSQVRATRELAGLRAPRVPSHWYSRSMADLGERAFAAVMLDASTADPFDPSSPETAVEDLRGLVDAAGDQFDARRWLLLADERGDIGVVLPQPFPRDPTTGTLFYLGVLPRRRGHGYGRSLHGYGLELLRLLGVERYVDSTDAANAAMIAIFEANGCEVTLPGADSA